MSWRHTLDQLTDKRAIAERKKEKKKKENIWRRKLILAGVKKLLPWC